MKRGRVAIGRRSQSITPSTRWCPSTTSSNGHQSSGRVPPVTSCGQASAVVPPQATFDPGQNIVALWIPAFSAVTHTGSAAFHQNGSLLSSMVNLPPGAGDILHVVRDDAVAIGALAGDERPVIGEGLGREGGAHRRRDPARGERAQHRRHPAIEIIGAEAVDRDEDRHRRPRLGAAGGGFRGPAPARWRRPGGGRRGRPRRSWNTSASAASLTGFRCWRKSIARSRAARSR